MWDLDIIARMNKASGSGVRPDGQANQVPPVSTHVVGNGAIEVDRQSLYGHPKFHQLLKEIGELHDKKNFDYAEGGEQGPLGNFKRIASIASLYPESSRWSSPTGVALTYMLKQLDAALMLLTTGKASKTGENMKERLRDVAIYALLGIILEEETR